MCLDILYLLFLQFLCPYPGKKKYVKDGPRQKSMTVRLFDKHLMNQINFYIYLKLYKMHLSVCISIYSLNEIMPLWKNDNDPHNTTD